MKPILFSLALFIGSIYSMQGQTYKIEYVYDEAGNRTIRNVITINTQERTPQKDITPLEEITFFGKITVFPNPTHGIIKINITSEEEEMPYTASVYSSSGKKVTDRFITGNGTFELDLSDYSSGIYILNLAIKNKEFQYKIIKK